MNVENMTRDQLKAKAAQLGLTVDSRTSTARLKVIVKNADAEARAAARAARANGETPARQPKNGVGKAVTDYLKSNGENATYEGAYAAAMAVNPESRFSKRHFSWYKCKAKAAEAAVTAGA